MSNLFYINNHYDSSKYNSFLFFWGTEQGLSQWTKTPFKVNNITFNTAEQFMMFEKAKLFNDDEIAKQILKTTNPRRQKALGRKVSNFDEKVWENHREDIVYRGNKAKFEQNEYLKEFLLDDTIRHKEFVEASPMDKIWGIGLAENNHDAKKRNKWKGKNLLGKILTIIRDEMIAKEG